MDVAREASAAERSNIHRGPVIGQLAFDLSLVVVSHGHEQFLGRCLTSLEKGLEGLRVEVILVDNLRTDGFLETVGKLPFPSSLHVNESPQGLARNANQGVKIARGRYVLLLNPDTMFLQGSVRDAIQFMDEEPRAGLVGCRLLNSDGSVQRNYRRFPILPVVLARGFGADRWAKHPTFYREYMMEDSLLDSIAQVDWVYGAFLLIRRDTYVQFGGLDEQFRLYYEDVDFCYRLRSRGLHTYYFPTIVLLHHHARASAARPLGQNWRWHVRSAWHFFTKHRYMFRPHLNGGSNGASPEASVTRLDRH